MEFYNVSFCRNKNSFLKKSCSVYLIRRFSNLTKADDLINEIFSFQKPTNKQIKMEQVLDCTFR